ncbi:MAG TPA: hypothetical protein VGL56_02605 [Fimbriimonadaceae bacterium]|jgi:hypothetical protein
MQSAALIIITASGLWLVAVSFLMARKPQYSLQIFERMTTSLAGSNWRLQLTEQGLRILAGVALIVRSPLSKLPLGFKVAGCCLVISSLVILLLPIQSHASYGRWCSRWLSPLLVRVLSPVPAIVGAGIVWAAV